MRKKTRFKACSPGKRGIKMEFTKLFWREGNFLTIIPETQPADEVQPEFAKYELNNYYFSKSGAKEADDGNVFQEVWLANDHAGKFLHYSNLGEPKPEIGRKPISRREYFYLPLTKLAVELQGPRHLARLRGDNWVDPKPKG